MKSRWVLILALLLAMLLPGAALAEGQVFHVAPSGVDDTAALEAALADAQAAGPDSVVELETGDYLISHAIVTRNWSGTIRGQGKYATLLHTNADPFPGIPLPEAGYGPYSTAGMLMFMYDNGAEARIQVEGLGLRPTGFSPYTEPVGDATIVPIVVSTGLQHTSAHVDAIWRDLSIQGDVTGAGMVVMWNSGDMRLSDVVIENILGFGFIGVLWEGGSLTVGGQRPADRVSFKDIGAGGIFGFGNTGTAFEITNVVAENVGVVYQQHALSGGRVHMSGVETTNGCGAAILSNWSYDWMDVATEVPSSYLFEHNTIRVPEGAGWAGFTVLEQAEVKSQFVISQNRIESAITDFRGPILLNGTRGALVTNNVLRGTGLAGISLGLFGGDDSGAVLKGNALQGFEGEVGVLLASATHDNTVVGGGKDIVLDEGTGNVVSGTRGASGEIGAAVREAMRALRDVRELWK